MTYFTWPLRRPGWMEPFLGRDGMGVFNYHLLGFIGSSLPTGKSASCSHPQKPSVLPAGPTSPLPCARARPCRCGHPHLHQSTMSPLLLRTRWPPAVWPAWAPASAPEYPVRPAEAKWPPSPTRLLPTHPLCFRSAPTPTPALTCRETAPLVDMRGKKCGLTYSKTPRSLF